jgi:hypothetical protein
VGENRRTERTQNKIGFNLTAGISARVTFARAAKLAKKPRDE